MEIIIHEENREGILKNIPQIKNGICAEIGVLEGYYSKKILEQNPKTLYLVDVWMPLENYEDITNNINYPDAFAKIKNLSASYPNKCVIIKDTSIQTSKRFKNNFFDFIYIDANHCYEEIKKDVLAWFPKVKSGGVLSGHDYLKFKWEENKNFLKNGKDVILYTENQITKIGGEESRGKKNKFGVFGVNPAINEFCIENNYELNITNEITANWWIVKK